MNEVPIMQVRSTENGEWFVAAKWPNGQTEQIKSFSTESQANEWVAKELQAWLDQRESKHA